MARLIYTSDLHGHLSFYRAAGQAARDWKADAIVLGGDLCPGTPSAANIDLPESQPEFLRRSIGPLVETWKRARPSLRVFAIPGNDDCQTVLAALDELERRELVENLHCAARTLGDHILVGLSFVPPTPFSIKDFERRDLKLHSQGGPQFARSVLGTPQGFQEIRDFRAYLLSLPSLEEELDRLPSSAPVRTIAVVHCPPYQTRCDVLFNGSHIGSKALRRWIEQVQPLLTLHGHIHESPQLSGSFFDRIGATTVINPGCDHSRPHLVFIDLENLTELEHSVYGPRNVP